MRYIKQSELKKNAKYYVLEYSTMDFYPVRYDGERFQTVISFCPVLAVRKGLVKRSYEAVGSEITVCESSKPYMIYKVIN